MTKNIFRRILSIVSALVIVFTAYPPVIFADDGGLCPHHPEHTAECGYVEGVSPCNFVCEICDPPEASNSTEPSDTSEPEMTTSPEEQPPVTTEAAPEESETMPTEPLPEPDSSSTEPEVQMMSLEAEPHNHVEDGIEWTAWTETDRLPETPGSYYLTDDVTLSDSWFVYGIVNLCLNGRNVEFSSGEIDVAGNLTVYSCRGGGEIRSSDYHSSYLVTNSYGTFTLKDGNIVSSGYAIYGGIDSSIIIDGGKVSGEESGIYLSGGNVEVNGGRINGVKYGIEFDSYYDPEDPPSSLSLSGDPIITGGMADIYLTEGNTITIDKPLDATDISIKMDTPGVFAMGDYAAASKGCFVPAEEGYSIVADSDGLKLVAGHAHDGGETFDKEWNDPDNLPTEAGNYYLTTNVTLGEYLYVQRPVNLCLNGLTVTTSTDGVAVKDFTVYDCQGGGEIGGKAMDTISVNGPSYNFTLESGKISNSHFSGCAILASFGNVKINGGEVNGYNNGINIYNNGTVSITDGKITGERNYAINTEYGTLNLSGQPELDGYEADIYIYHKFPMNISDLTNTEPYSIAMDTPGVFATVTDGSSAEDYVKNFTSANDDYTVVAEGNSLKLVEVHRHTDGEEFLPWESDNTLPTSAGNWYLKQPVTLTGGWTVPEGEVKLCLNGQTVNCGGNQITVGSGSSLTVYDCDLDKNGEINGSSDKTIHVNGGTFTLKSGKIFNNHSNGDTVWVDNSGSAAIEGGTVEATGQAIYGASASTINVTGGEIKGGSGSLVYAIQTYDTLEISGGKITSAEDKAVRITSDDSNFNLSGSSVIDGIQLDGRAVITIDKALSGQYVVYGSGVENQVFAQGSRAAEAIDCFVLSQDLQDEGYVIVAVENGLKATILHSHGDGTEFEALDYKSDLPDKAGNYFLADMAVRLEDTWVVPEGETTLCLNGNMIMNSDQSIDIPENATLIICDCSIHRNGGIIFENAACINVSGKLILKSGTIMNGLSGKAINVGSSGTLIIEDGTVSGEACAIYGESGSNILIYNGEISGDQGSAISTAGNLTVSGGSMTGNIYYGIDVTGELTLAGDPTITISTKGTLTSADIHVTNPINITAPIFGESYSVYMDKAPGVFAKGDGAAESFECFTSANSDYRVEKVGSEFWLVPKDAHVHEDGTIFLPWDGSTTPANGNFYLKDDVSLSEQKNISTNVNLCLNGQTLNCDQGLSVTGNLTVFDCSPDEKGEIKSSDTAIRVLGGAVTINSGNITGGNHGIDSRNNGASVIINGGVIKGATSYGVFADSGNIEIRGGTIISESEYAVEAYNADSFKLSGNPTIQSAEYYGAIDFKIINIDKELTGGPYTISPRYSDEDSITFAEGAYAAASKECFKLMDHMVNEGYEIAAVDGTLVMKLKTYTIKYEPGEGDDISGDSFTETKTHGTNIKISDKKFTRPGYTQTGWSTKQGARNVEYAFGENYRLNADLTLYPVWELNEIHFYNGVDEIKSLSLKVGERMTIEARITPESAVCGTVQWTVDNGISINPNAGETITVTGDSAGEFELTASTDGDLTTKTLTVNVTRFDSAVSADNQTVTYGDEVTIKAKVEKAASNGIALIADYDNKVTFKLGDNELGTAYVVGDTATLTIPATRANGFVIGNNTVILQYNGNGELNPITGSVTVTVNKKTLTATITGTTTKTYDGTTSADDLGLELELSGIVVGDTVGASAEFAYDSTNAGERTISAANAKLDGEHADYYELSTPIPTVSGTIFPLPAQLAWTDDEFTYDGTSHEVTATVENAVGDDKFEIKYADNSAVDVGNYTAKVADLGNENYTLTGATGVEHEWKITALSLADAQIEIIGSYTYNGEPQTPEIRVTLGGKELLSDKDYTLEYSGEVKDADTYTVTLIGVGNYSGSANAEFEIAPKFLTASISGTLSKAYDGTADVNNDVKITLTGVIEGDVVTATAEIAYDSANAGARKIIAKNITLSGEDSKNYTLSSTQAEASGSITPVPITLPDSSFIYGGEAKTVIQVSGIGETVTATLTAFSSDAGEYEYSETAKEGSYTAKLSSENYKVQSAGTLTIKPRVAVLEWQGGEFTYDGAVHEVTAAVENAVNGDKFNITYTDNTATEAGDYTAKVTDLGNTNYALNDPDALQWSILPAVAEFTWVGDAFAYDGQEHSVSAEIKKVAENDEFALTYKSEKSSKIGSYTAEVTSLGNSNYTLDGSTSKTHGWSITKSVLTVATLPTAADITYGQSLSDSALTGGVVMNGKIAVSGSFAWVDSDETPAVKDSGKSFAVVFTPDDSSYDPIKAEVTITVNKAVLTPKIGRIDNKVYDGGTVANGVITLSGAKFDDVPTATAKFNFVDKNAGKNKSVNVSDITLAEGWSDNYELSTGSLLNQSTNAEILPRAVEIEWTGEDFAYDGESHTVTATVKNAVMGDKFELKYTGNTATEAGNYTAKVTALGNTNYTLNCATGIEHKWKITALSIAEAEIEIVGTYTYNGEVQFPEIIVILGGKALSSGDYTVAYSDEVKDVNTYTVTLTGIGNYSGSANAEFEIAPKFLTASISGTLSKAYDGTADVNNDVKITLTGVIEGDVVTATAEISYDSENAGARKIIAKNITLSGEAAKNYTLSSKQAEASGSVTPAPITLPDSSFIYGGEAKTVIQISGIGETVTATLTVFSSDAGEYEYSETAKEGSYTVELSSENYKVQSAGTLAIKPLVAIIEWRGGEFTYDGNAHEVTATVKNAVSGDKFEIAYTGNTATEAGDYTAKVTALGNTNYTLEGANEYEWEIAPRVAEIEWVGDEFTYDGEPHTVTATVKNAVAGDKFEIEYTGNTATEAGNYTAKITALGNANYTLNGATGVEHKWQITAASQAAPEVKIDFINETLSTDETMEFSADGETWQDCTAAMNVAKTGWNGSAMTVKIRYKKDVDHLDGEIQSLVIPARRAAPDISETAVSKSQTEIKIAEIAGCEYSLDGATWQDSGSFSELDKGETYEIHVRHKATSSAFASFVTSKTVVTSSTADGTTELLPGETVTAGDGSIKNLGGEIIIDDGAGNMTTVTLPDGGSVEVDEQGNVTVPGGGEVAVGDNPAVSLPVGGKVEPGGTVIADEVKIGDTDVKGEDVTVTSDGNITVPGEGSVKVGDTPEIILPTGGTVEPDGTVIADEVKIGDTDVKGEDVTVASDGNITVPGEGSVKVGDNPEIILPTGGMLEPDGTVIADEVKIGNTDVKGEDVTVTPDGNIIVPGEGRVKVGDNPEITLLTGGTVEPDGTVTADEVKVGNTDVKGEDVTVAPDGNITVPGEGSVKVGDNPKITLPTGGTVEPDGTVIADEVKIGDTDVKGEDVTVTPDGIITLPEGGKVSADGEPEKIVPAGTTVENGEINAHAIAEPADGTGSLGDSIILKIEPADERLETADRENLKDTANAIVREVYDIELLKNGVEIQPDKSIKLTVLADVSGAKMKVFMLDNDEKFTEMNAEFDVENGKFIIVTDSLGIFILASEEGQISAEVVASGGAPEVEISDDDRKILEENLFTDEDEAAIENGDNVKVVMNVEGVSEEDVSADDLAEIKAFLDDLESCEVAEYADITLTKITEDGVTGDEIRSEAISEINNPIKLVIDIPEALHKVGRIFSVIRLHDGKAELLNDTDQSDETVTILTDKFSLYVLIYRDPASQPSHVHSFSGWVSVGEVGHRACCICGKTLALMPHTFRNGVCTMCGYIAQLPDDSETVNIEVPTEGKTSDEEMTEF